MKVFSISLIAALIAALAILGCEENIYEASETSGEFFRGDLVGKVKQKDSGARVVVSQVSPIDSTDINPSTGAFGIYGLKIGNYDLIIQTNNYRTYKYKNVLINGGSVTYLGEIDLSTVPDLVSNYYPKDRDEVVFSSRGQRLSISILFTNDMDRESVEQAFSTDPPTEGIFYWGRYTTAPGPIYYTDERTGAFDESATITTFSKISSVTYQIAQKDAFVDTTYKVTLGNDAHDTSGVHLRFPLEFSFSTVQSAVSYSGILTSPFHGDIDVEPLKSSMTLTFPRRMDTFTTEAALTVVPQHDYVTLWPLKNELKIYTGGPFYADTTYQITIAASAEDLDGIPLGEDFTFSFETAPVSITSTDPRNAEVYVGLDDEITFWFNTYILKSSIESAFSIDPLIAGSFRWGTQYSSDIKNAVTFNHSAYFSANTKYTVTVGKGTRDLYGKSIGEPYEFSFVTIPEP